MSLSVKFHKSGYTCSHIQQTTMATTGQTIYGEFHSWKLASSHTWTSRSNETKMLTVQRHTYPHTKGLFLHDTWDFFTLVVNNFGIEYTNKNNVNHLITSVRAKYSFQVDWESKQYTGMYL